MTSRIDNDDSGFTLQCLIRSIVHYVSSNEINAVVAVAHNVFFLHYFFLHHRKFVSIVQCN